MKPTKPPLIGICCCSTVSGIHPQQFVGDKYINAVVEQCHATPVLIPAFGTAVYDSLNYLDGLLLTGSYSNINPRHYGGEGISENLPTDPKRDSTNLALLKLALKAKLPVLGICRGFQEMNVVMGGTLHQRLSDVAGLTEHSEDKTKTIDKQYKIAHEVMLTENGILAGAMHGELSHMVNSLHGQGIAKLGAGLKVEARAPDGLIEAFSLQNNDSYYLGVQWHPEWRIDQHPFYQATFKTFKDACCTFKQTKH